MQVQDSLIMKVQLKCKYKLYASEMLVQVKWMGKWNASFSDSSASPGDYANEMQVEEQI